MVRFFASDATFVDQGHRSFLVGVTLDIENGTEFDDYYFDTIKEICVEYDIEVRNSVLDASSLLSQVRSYELRDAQDDLFEGLLNNPAINEVHATIGWFLDEVIIGGDELSGKSFTERHLCQYFPVVAAWDHYNHVDWDTAPDEIWVDNVQDRITKAWKILCDHLDTVNVVPHGDRTYPSIATADVLANHIGRLLPRDKDFKELHKSAYPMLIEAVGESESVSTDYVNEEDSDYLVPKYDYSIRSQLYWPHPVYFVHDQHFGSNNRNALQETEFHGVLRREAQENGGCVVGLDPNQLPGIVKDGDTIVYTKGTDTNIPEILRDFNPTTEVSIRSSEDVITEFFTE